MVARVHDDAADLGPAAQVARTAGLAQVLVLMVEVAHLATVAMHRTLTRRTSPDGSRICA
jgi:hypothetical protein